MCEALPRRRAGSDQARCAHGAHAARAHLVRVGSEEHGQQRDREDGKRSDAHDGRKGEEALVALVDLHGGLDRLRSTTRGSQRKPAEA